MSVISCVVNFKENLSKSVPYCNLLLGQINNAQTLRQDTDVKICEHAALSSSQKGSVVSKICEGYQFVIVFSGELFGTDLLRHELDSFGYCFTDGSDAELALFAYIHFGNASPTKLSGNFSYIIYDSMRRKVFAVCDSRASMPLFYGHIGDATVISSSLCGVLAHPDAKATISQNGISEIISIPRKFSNNIFEGIYMLSPSHSLTISHTHTTLKSYTSQDCFISNNKLPDTPSISMVFSGSDADCQLLTTLAPEQAIHSRRITVYSQEFYPLFDNYCVRWVKIPINKETVFSALEKTVIACGLPTLSSSDFLLPIIFDRLCEKNETVLSAIGEASENPRNYLSILIKNNALHPAVSRTILTEDFQNKITLNSYGLVGQSFDISLKTVPIKGHSDTPSQSLSLKTALRRILLEIISKDTSPILAFFRQPALLRLCEGNFDFSGSGLTECELISYIIKVNIWLLKFHPTLI